jgi:hypothetical protein
MDKKAILFSVLLNSILLFSCQNNPTLLIDRNGDLIGKNNQAELESLMISVNTDGIHRLLSAEESMVLYIGNEFCSSCQILKPNLKQYLLEYQPVLYHFNNLNSENLLTYDSLVTTYPEIFSRQIQTPSFYFIERNNRLFHFQPATQEFLTYRSFEAIMNYRVTINPNITKNSQNIQEWILVKAFENNPVSIENIDLIYDYFTNENELLSWIDHAKWAESETDELSFETSYLINVSIQPYQVYDLSQLTALELTDLLY